jgi:hypothetical protein
MHAVDRQRKLEEDERRAPAKIGRPQADHIGRIA